MIPGTRRSLLRSPPRHATPSAHTRAPPHTPISTRIPDEGTQQAAAKPAAKERDDLMHQQTGRDVLPAAANVVLPLQPGCQETETQLQKVFCHPSLLGRDLQVQKSCPLWYEVVPGASVDPTSDQRTGTGQTTHPEQQRRTAWGHSSLRNLEDLLGC